MLCAICTDLVFIDVDIFIKIHSSKIIDRKSIRLMNIDIIKAWNIEDKVYVLIIIVNLCDKMA